MIAALVLFALFAGGGVGYSIGRWGNSLKAEADRQRDLEEFRITEQQRLLAESREAHYRGELGLAQTLQDAAERVMLRSLPPAKD